MWKGWIFARWKCQQTRNVWLLILLPSHTCFLHTSGWSHAEFISNWQKTETGTVDVLAKFHFKLYAKVYFHNTIHTMMRSVNVSIVKIPLQKFFSHSTLKGSKKHFIVKRAKPQPIGWAAGPMKVDKSKQWLEILNTVFLNSVCLHLTQSSIWISSCWTYMRFNMVDL